MSGCCRGVSMDPAGGLRSTCWRAWGTFFPAFGPAVQAALGSSFLPTYSYIQKEIYKAYKLICAIYRLCHYPFIIIPPFSWPTRSNSPSFMLLSVYIGSLTPSQQQMFVVGPLSEELGICREKTCQETQFSSWNESWAPVGGFVWATAVQHYQGSWCALGVTRGSPCPLSSLPTILMWIFSPSSDATHLPNEPCKQVPLSGPSAFLATTTPKSCPYHCPPLSHTRTHVYTHRDKINTSYISFK